MKRILCLLLTVLLIFSFTSCKEKEPEVPTAKELFENALAADANREFSIVAGIALTQDGEPVNASFTADVMTDDSLNTKIEYFVGVPVIGVSFSGNAYYFHEQQDLYIQVMGIWARLNIPEFYAAAEMEYDAGEIAELIAAYEKLDKELMETGIEYSEVTVSEGSYTFDITTRKEFVDIIKNVILLMLEDSEDYETYKKELSDEHDYILKHFEGAKINITINQSNRKFREIAFDMTQIMNTIIEAEKAAIEEAIRKETGDYESELVPSSVVKIKNCSLDITYYSYGTVNEILMDETIQKVAVNLADMMNESYEY